MAYQKILVVYLGIQTLISILLALPCPTATKCDCSYREEGIYVDCAHRSLSHTPNFSFPVVGVDLSNNSLNNFPTSLSRQLMYLSVSLNDLYILKKNSIRGYPNLIELRLKSCRLRTIERHSFNQSNLQYLNIARNGELTLLALKNISCDLEGSPIDILILDQVQCATGPSVVLRLSHVVCLKNTSLQTISLASNRVSYIESGVLSTLPKSLKSLNLSNNILTFGYYVLETVLLQSLKVLDLSYQYNIAEINFECVNRMESNKLLENRSKRKLAKIINETFYFPKALEMLYFHNSAIRAKLGSSNDLFKHFKFGDNISHVILRNNVFYEWKGPLYGFSSVKHLDLSNNLCTRVQQEFFVDGTSLIFLDISKNILAESLAKDTKGITFKTLTSLEILNISSNKITTLPHRIFQSLKYLKILRLSRNQITKFDLLIRHMKNLSFLDISFNQIDVLPKVTRDAIDEIASFHSIQVNMYGNPISCGCEDVDFIKWLLHPLKNIVLLYSQNLSCDFENRRFTLNSSTLLKLDKHCASYSLLIFISSTIIFLFIMLAFVSIVYRYRWRLRYLYYITSGKTKDATGKSSLVYRYDAFISFADENKTFVLDIINALESKSSIKVCFHSRDFIPGTSIADNISNAIQNSRHTVCVMTSHFLQSYWCMFEFNIARMVSFYSRGGKNILILVLLNKPPVKEMPLNVLEFLRSNSYLEYPGSFPDKESFTSNLAEHL